jgi:hypothetical protein
MQWRMPKEHMNANAQAWQHAACDEDRFVHIFDIWPANSYQQILNDPLMRIRWLCST